MVFPSCPATSTRMLTTSQTTYPVIVSSPKVPQASPRPVQVPQQLISLLLNPRQTVITRLLGMVGVHQLEF